MRVSVSEAKGQLTELVRKAEAGDEVVLTRHGKPAVRLIPVTAQPTAADKKSLLDSVRASGSASAARGASAARSQDFLYGDDGLPQMIAADTSALMAVILNEPRAAACARALQTESELTISAATVAEALIVADSRNVSAEMTKLLDGLGFEVVPVTLVSARRVMEVYRKWGKGRHAAALNFGDCFAYDAAKTHACPLLFVGEDFRKTDLESVL